MIFSEKPIEPVSIDKNHYVISPIANYPVLNQYKYLLYNHKGFIAGGCFKDILSGEQPKDIDIFFESEEDFNAAVSHFQYSMGFKRKYENDKVIAFNIPNKPYHIELIRRIYGTPVEIMDRFDFSVTRFSLVSDISGNLHTQFAHNFFEHLMLKRLVIDLNVPFPVSTLERTWRYAKKGFFLCKDSKEKLIKAIHTINDENISGSLYDGWD